MSRPPPRRHTMADLQTGESRMRAATTGQSEDAWMDRALPPLQRLMRFCRQRRRREDEDRRLESLLAAIAVQPQRRVLPPNATTVALVGCGRMGVDITGELLRRGCTLRVYERTTFARERALRLIAGTMQKHCELGLLLPHDDRYLLQRLSVHSSIDEAVRGAALAIEAIVEDLPAKVRVLREMATALANQNVPPAEVLLASSTVSIPMQDLVDGLAQHEQALPYVVRVVGMRFLDPTWYIDDVELTLPVVEMEPRGEGPHRPGAPSPVVRGFFTGGPFGRHLARGEAAAM